MNLSRFSLHNFALLFLAILHIASLPFVAYSQQLSMLQREFQTAATVPVQDGDRCIVCGAKLSDQDVVFMVRGRRVPVAKSLVDELKANPEKYFFSLQPKGALFSEDSEGSGDRWNWFIFGIFVLVSTIVFGLFSSIKTKVAKGSWKAERTSRPVVCDYCFFPNHPAAESCTSCSRSITPRYKAEASRA